MTVPSPAAMARIAIASSYGLSGEHVRRAYDAGVRVFVWGALRHRSFGRGLAGVLRQAREKVECLVVSYARSPLVLRLSLESARRRLGIDSIDLVVLGYQARWDAAMVDAALALRDRGVFRALGIASHDRHLLAEACARPELDAIMARYSAAHPGAETEIFPFAGTQRVLSYTATRWGTLLDPEYVPRGERLPHAVDCYRFVLSCPRVDLCLAGPKDGRELEATLEAGRRGPLAEDERAWMLRVGRAVRARAKLADPPRARLARVGRSLRSLLRHGVTEDILSRLNR